MRYSSMYIPTLRETPADAEVVSHQLLLRAGMIRRLASGLYVYLPLGLRVLEKISSMVRKEMNAAGFQELLLPVVQPGELWKESGRWEHYGKELLRFKDRNDREYCLGPTHEEVITDLVRNEVRSWRQMPLRFYQIQTKFRDEIRPRFGLMRGREFLMKDAYSFDADLESASESYELMRKAYNRVFANLGLRYRAVEADTGSIGGNFSHEFMVLADTGEDVIASCSNCDYAANLERAELNWQGEKCASQCPPVSEVETPSAHTVEQVTTMLNVGPEKLIKTMIFLADGKPVAALVRGDREVNDIKLKHLLNAQEVVMAPPEVVRAVTKAPTGFAGPVGLEIPVYADNELQANTDYIAGANKKDAHIMHLDLDRDANVSAYADLRQVVEDDACPRCGGKMHLTRGIEVGHIFMLGTKYSDAMKAVFTDEQGLEKPMIQGCYGIGVSRVAAAAIEQNHDERGIILPPPIAPFSVALLNLDPANKEVNDAVEQIYELLEKSGEEVLLDDRVERPGIKFNDADLIGIPMQIVIGAKGLAKGVAECKDRRTGQKSGLALANFQEEFANWKNSVLEGWMQSIK